MPQPRTLPHRPEAENAVLGGVLLRGREGLQQAREFVSEEDFYQPRAQAVWRAMRILDERGEPIDVVTLEAQLLRTGELDLVGGIEGIARLDRYATAHNIKAHAELIRESAQVRNTVVVAREIAEEGMGEVEDPKAFLASSKAKIAGVADARVKRSYRSANEVMQEAFPGVVERKKLGDRGRTVTGIPTSLMDLDALTQGLQPTDLVVLAARPSVGKTAAALQMVRHASVCRPKHWRQLDAPRLFPALFFSLEMSATQLMERALAAEAGIKFEDLRSTAPFQKGDMERLVRAGERIAAARWAIDDQGALSIDEITARATRWREDPYYWPPDAEDNDGLGLIGVDYLQLARGRQGVKYQSREQEVGDISRGLKALAKALRVPVLALAQLNRAVDSRADHRPQLSDLRESGAIEQDADVIMFLYRAERYLPPDAPADKLAAVEGKAEFIVGKQRNGALGTVHAHFNKREQKFENAAREDYYSGL